MGNTEYRILLVDDEPDILEFLGYNLRKEGYAVFSATNGREAMKIAQETQPHLIILDVMMPEMDGIETCREIRQIPSLQKSIIIFLTARNEDYSQIAGFEAGADDYIAKPVKPKILIIKIKALLRRYGNHEGKQQLEQYGSVLINREKYSVSKDGVELTLPKKEFELLSLLTSNINKVLTRDEIYSRIWGKDVIVGDRTIDVHIRKLREKLGLENIKTIKGVGYRFEL